MPWVANESDNTLIIKFDELVNKPVKTLNRIEKFFGLPVTTDRVELDKQRYSRRPPLQNALYLGLKTFRSGAHKAFKAIGLEKPALKVAKRLGLTNKV